ncbi:MAG: phosphohistidine phosphatase SixA [Candidatus Binatia bacterium]
MNLYFMRHGIAVPRDDPKICIDEERPLTRKGSKRMRKAANGLLTLDLDFDRIFTSPLVRARQTAEIVAEKLGLEARLEDLPELSPQTAVEELASRLAGYRELENLLLVGHEPLLSKTVAYLLAGEKELRMELKKGGLCRLELDRLPAESRALLHWMLTPRQLRALRDH